MYLADPKRHRFFETTRPAKPQRHRNHSPTLPPRDEASLKQHEDVSGPQPRIYKGCRVPPGKFTGFVGVSKADAFNGEPFCGGAVIHPEWVLSSIHCVQIRHPTKKWGRMRVDEVWSILVDKIWTSPCAYFG